MVEEGEEFMQEKVVLGRTWQKEKKGKKGKVWKIQSPAMGSGVQIVQYSVLLYRRYTLKGWIYAGGI
jgi:hypothetical protein